MRVMQNFIFLIQPAKKISYNLNNEDGKLNAV